jgi:hypothetical protein
MQRIGTVKWVQIQRKSLKIGEEPDHVYRSDALLVVDKLQLTPGGVLGMSVDGTVIIDVHHIAHPYTRFRGNNRISFGFLQHYQAISEYFEQEIKVGCGGENIMIDAEIDVTNLPDSSTLFIQHGNTWIELTHVTPAPPCRAFSEFCAGRRLFPKEVKMSLQFLDHGRRGYYAALGFARQCSVVEAGNIVFMA